VKAGIGRRGKQGKQGAGHTGKTEKRHGRQKTELERGKRKILEEMNSPLVYPPQKGGDGKPVSILGTVRSLGRLWKSLLEPIQDLLRHFPCFSCVLFGRHVSIVWIANLNRVRCKYRESISQMLHFTVQREYGFKNKK
jgi:hypothetical protein